MAHHALWHWRTESLPVTLNLTNFDPVLKQYYTDNPIEDMVYADNPLYALINKSEKFPGRNLPIPIKYGNTQGVSATFARAQANKGNSQFSAFLLTRVKDYALYSVDNETLEATEEDEGAFLEALTTEADSAFEQAARDLAVAIYRSGTGSIGQISAGSTVSATTITLANINDVSNFEVNMKLNASASDGGTTRNSSALTTLAKVNRITGVLTTSEAAWNTTITNLAASDFLYRDGDAANNSTNLKMSGLAAWIPATDPTATLFFGVDRSVDVTRLGGIRYDGSGQNPEEALIDGCALLCREGGKPNYIFTHTSDFANVEKSLGTKVVYNMVEIGEGDAMIGFQGIKMNTPKGPAVLLGDVNCPSGLAYPLTMKSLKLYSMGKAPKILKYKSQDSYLREGSSDSVEGRIGLYGNVGFNAPGWNGRIAMPT